MNTTIAKKSPSLLQPVFGVIGSKLIKPVRKLPPAFSYGLPDMETALLSPVRYRGSSRLLTPKAEEGIKNGSIPNLKKTCENLFNALFVKNTSYTPLQFIDVLQRHIELNQEEIQNFISSTDQSCVLVQDPIVKIVLIHWKPGKKSSIHPHYGKGGVFKILQGSLEEKRYDSKRPWRLISHSTLHKDSISYIDNKMGLHAVENNFDTHAISLHAYVCTK